MPCVKSCHRLTPKTGRYKFACYWTSSFFPIKAINKLPMFQWILCQLIYTIYEYFMMKPPGCMLISNSILFIQRYSSWEIAVCARGILFFHLRQFCDGWKMISLYSWRSMYSMNRGHNRRNNFVRLARCS